MIGVIPERQSLTRPLTLPFAAKAHVDEAVRYQIERVSPFKADNTLYDIKQLEGGAGANELRLKLTIVSKASVAELKERSAKFGLRIDHFAIEAPDGGALETLAFAGESAPRGKMSLEAKALLAAAFILAASLVFVPIVGKWEQAKALEKEVSTLKPKAEQVLKLQSERDKIVARRAQMISLKKAALELFVQPLDRIRGAHAAPLARRQTGEGESRSPASSRLSATARCLSRHLRMKALRRASISSRVAA